MIVGEREGGGETKLEKDGPKGTREPQLKWINIKKKRATGRPAGTTRSLTEPSKKNTRRNLFSCQVDDLETVIQAESRSWKRQRSPDSYWEQRSSQTGTNRFRHRFEICKIVEIWPIVVLSDFVGLAKCQGAKKPAQTGTTGSSSTAADHSTLIYPTKSVHIYIYIHTDVITDGDDRIIVWHNIRDAFVLTFHLRRNSSYAHIKSTTDDSIDTYLIWEEQRTSSFLENIST